LVAQATGRALQVLGGECMGRIVAGLAVGLLVLAPDALLAQEPPHLEFVRGLRAQHYPDLALEYLEKLNKDPAHAQDPLIVLEMAKTRLDLAVQETNADRRLAIYLQAGADLERFLNKYPNHPLAADAQLEKAHISVLQGKTQLSKFLRQESASGRNHEAVQARTLLANAGKELESAAALIEKQRGQYTGEPKNEQEREERRALDEARLQVELDLGLNGLDQAQTYLDDGSGALLAERGAIVKKAVASLEKAGNRDSKNPTCWLARAWAAYAYQELGDPEKSRIRLNDVATEIGKHAEPGKRLARYYLMKLNFESPKASADPTKAAKALQEEADKWVKDYASSMNTPEGFGVRYLLAQAHFQEGEKEAKLSVARKQHFDRARVLCRELERGNNEFSTKAQQTLIAVVQADGGFEKPADKLDKFDDCVIRAQYEAFQLKEESKREPPKDPKEVEKAEKKREERMKTIVAVLAHALEIAKTDARITPQDVGQAANMLCGYYLFMGKHLSAVKEGEPFVRVKPPTEQGAATGIYVMEAYSLLIGKRLKAGESIDDLADKRAEFRKLAEYVEATWPNDAAADHARHQLGLLAFKENKPADAVEALARIRPTYSGRVFSQELLARCALQADERKLPPAANDKRPWEDIALAALQGMPELPSGADPATTDVYLQAKIELSSLYLKAKKYDHVERLIEPLLQEFPKFKLDGPTRAELLRNELAQRKWYAYGSRAEAEYAAGHFDKVREQLDPIVEKLGKDELPELKENPQLTRALIGLALRAHLQDKQLDKAQEILKVLQKSITEGSGKDDGGAGVLQSVAQLVQDQITELRGKGDKEGLAKAIDGLSAFLDDLVKQQKALTPELARILAMSYASLDKHQQALKLLEKIEEPKAAGGKEPEPALVENYRAARILYVRELRKDKKLYEAEAALKEIEKTDWGKQSFEVRKESLLQLDAQGKHAGATKEWDEIITKQLLPKINDNATIKDQYFECNFYYFSALLHYVQGQKDEAKRAKYLRQLAVSMVRLETAWPDLGGPASKANILGLLDEDAKLKELVNELRKASNK
jgi:hypothetical protein